MSDQPEWHDFGALHAATAFRWEGNRHCCGAVVMAFDDGRSVGIEALTDDTLSLVVPGPSGTNAFDPGLAVEMVDVSAEHPWAAVIGRRIVWGRTMVNHHGWLDGYQFEFSSDDGMSLAVDLIAEASTLTFGLTTLGR